MVIKRKANNIVLSSGTRIARYTIERKLASGGFGVVYAAKRDDGASVAIKEFMPSSLACRTVGDKGKVRINNPADQKRFQEGLDTFFREADMLARVQDDKVIAVWDVFKENGTAYFVMPVEKGVTLQASIKNSYKMLSDGMIRELFIQAAKGVEALHENGLLHLDIKPHNLWLRPNGNVVVLDLGASRWKTEKGRTGQMIRTPGFAAPEQHGVIKFNDLSVKTDVYGLAASMYAALEGKAPPHAPDRQKLKNEVPMLLKRVGQRHPQLLKVVDKGMSLDINNRYNSIRELRLDLEKVPRQTDEENTSHDFL